MSTGRRLSALVMLATLTSAASAQMFTGSPTIGNWSHTGGGVVATPSAFIDQGAGMLEIQGVYCIQNPPVGNHSASFTAMCDLDSSFNGGVPLLMQFTIEQDGWLNLPAGAGVDDWTVTARTMSGSTVLDSFSDTDPGGPYGPGVSYYNDSATGAPFSYTPGGRLELDFVTHFPGNAGTGIYTWSFPVRVRFTPVPEPMTLLTLGLGTSFILRLRRRTKS